MSLRNREQQVAELNAQNQQIVDDAKLPESCNKEDCIFFNTTCPAGWIQETTSEVNKLKEFPQDYDERQTRGLNSEIRLIPRLLIKVEECVEKVAKKEGPIEIDLLELIGPPDPNQ